MREFEYYFYVALIFIVLSCISFLAIGGIWLAHGFEGVLISFALFIGAMIVLGGIPYLYAKFMTRNE